MIFSTRGVFLAVSVLFWSSIASAKAESPGYIGVVLQESVGAGRTLTDAGHLTIIATHLCADGIVKVRHCAEDEPHGVILGRYSRLSSNLDIDWMVLPLNVALNGTSDYADTPLISSEGINQAMELKYWRENLQDEIPDLTLDQYRELAKKKSKITAGKVVSDAVAIGLIIDYMDRGQAAEQSAGIKDPESSQMVPAGRWMESIGIREHRGSAILMVQSTEMQEQRLAAYLNGLPNDHSKFKKVGGNCADFSHDALAATFTDPQISFPSKIADPADVFGLVTSPLMVTKGLLNYAEKLGLDYQVLFAPQLAGTVSSSTIPRSIARGILVPDATQGKVSFLMKLIFTKLNYLIPSSAFVADLISRPLNLNKEAHKHPEEVAQMRLTQVDSETDPADDTRKKAEQVRTYGTDACWKSTRQEYKSIIRLAQEAGVLSKQESGELSASKPGKVMIQWLEKQGLSAQYDEKGQLRVRLGEESSGVTRRNILDYHNSPALSRTLAFKISAAAIHYDLVSNPLTRRQSDEFDGDWQQFLEIAKDNGIQAEGPSSISQCALAELAQNPETKDSLESAMSFKSTLIRSLGSLIKLRW